MQIRYHNDPIVLTQTVNIALIVFRLCLLTNRNEIPWKIRQLNSTFNVFVGGNLRMVFPSNLPSRN